MLELFQDGKPVNSLSFPITKVGHESTIKAQIKNRFEDVAEIKVKVNDPDVTILESPKTLIPNNTGEFVAVFRPKIERKTPLNGQIDFEVVIG